MTTSTMFPMNKKKYESQQYENPGCPYCKSVDVNCEIDEPDLDGLIVVLRDFTCNKCGFTWREDFSLTDVWNTCGR